MKNSINKNITQAILIAAVATLLYIIGLLACIYAVSKHYSNVNEETCIAIGYDQGRRSVLDSLNTVNHATQIEKKTRFGSNGTFHGTNAL